MAKEQPGKTVDEQEIDEAQREKNQAAIEVIMRWAADESGYEEEVWPIMKKIIEENRLSDRKRFHD